MNYTYIVECSDGSYYTGWTTDLTKRVKAHNSGTGAKYTRTRGPVELVYYEEHETKVEAMQREYAIKQLTRSKKEALIQRKECSMREETLVWYKENGQKIMGKAFWPKEEGKKYPTVIFAHGFNCNYRQLQHHGEGFAERGIACVFFDFCGGGPETLSDGTVQEMTVLTEIEDLRTVLDQVRKLDCVDEEQIFLQGESMGGLVSALVAASMPEQIKALVLWYPAFVIPDDAKKRYENQDDICFGIQLSPEYNRTAMELDVYAEIPAYQGPVKIIHGSADPVVPLSYSQKALEVYRNADLVVLPDAGHGFDGEDSRNARLASVEFIQEQICHS